MEINKLGIIIPYRNRKEHLEQFLVDGQKFFSSSGYSYNIIIVEQNSQKKFNRGKLLNIGFKYGVEHGCNYFAFHDVDVIPCSKDLINQYKVPATPKSLIGEEGCIGSVFLIQKKDFEEINGFSNEYWGWGFEDNDLLQRLLNKNILLDKSEYVHRDTEKVYESTSALDIGGFRVLPHPPAIVGEYLSQDELSKLNDEQARAIVTEKWQSNPNKLRFQQFMTNPELQLADGLNNLSFKFVKSQQILQNVYLLNVDI